MLATSHIMIMELYVLARKKKTYNIIEIMIWPIISRTTGPNRNLPPMSRVKDNSVTFLFYSFYTIKITIFIRCDNFQRKIELISWKIFYFQKSTINRKHEWYSVKKREEKKGGTVLLKILCVRFYFRKSKRDSLLKQYNT